MTVYFIGCDELRAVKIGYTSSSDASGRLASLQTGSPHKLSILAVVPGPDSLEKRLHREFSRSRLSGEWFSHTTILEDLIQWAKSHGTIDGWVRPLEPLVTIKRYEAGDDPTVWKDLFYHWSDRTRNVACDSTYVTVVHDAWMHDSGYASFVRRDPRFGCVFRRGYEDTAIIISTGQLDPEWRAALWMSIAIRNASGGPSQIDQRRSYDKAALDRINDAVSTVFVAPWHDRVTAAVPVHLTMHKSATDSASLFVAHAAALRAETFAQFSIETRPFTRGTHVCVPDKAAE